MITEEDIYEGNVFVRGERDLLIIILSTKNKYLTIGALGGSYLCWDGGIPQEKKDICKSLNSGSWKKIGKLPNLNDIKEYCLIEENNYEEYKIKGAL